MNWMTTFGKWVLVAAVVTVLGFAVPGCEKGPAGGKESAADVVKATVEGENFCLGCALKKQKGAAAQCSVYGHKHSLKVTKAVGEDGKELTGLHGAVLHYLETDKSQEAIHKHHGENLEITGKIYPHERILEVESIKQK